MPSAYLLVSHGSRDPRPEAAMEQLVKLVAQVKAQVETAGWVQVGDQSLSKAASSCLVSPSQPLVDKACLELSSVPLTQQIQEFGARALANSCNRIQVIPIFLLPGTHVMEDIPAQVAIAQQALGQKLQVDLRPHLGTHPGLVQLLANQMNVEADAWILLAHGSRRPGSTQPIAAIAQQLNAYVAYWAVAPSLPVQVQKLISAGYRQIGIIPYFLFPGGITDAIAQTIAQLQVHPEINLHLAEPIGASQQLAELIWDLVE